MNRLAPFCLLLTSIWLLSACASFRQTATEVGRAFDIVDEPAVIVIPNRTPAELIQALKQIDASEYEAALTTLDQFLQRQPTSPWTQSASFHRGRALEGLGRPSEAADQYRSVVRASEGIAPKLQAMSLYRLSFCHEAMGDDQLALAVLHDLQTRTKSLPKEISDAELPARLAGAYARVGNFDKAVSYYRSAEAGILRLRRGISGVPEWLPRTLYSMGTISTRAVSWEDFETALRPIARSQIYLLQAAELGIEPWSARASRDLITAYTNLWKVIESPPKIAASEPVLAQRSTQESQLTRAEILYENLQELKARSLATESDHGAEASREALNFVTDLEKKIRKLFDVRRPGEGLTREAKARRSSVRGQTRTTDDSLEQKFLKNSRSVQKPSAEDPNL